MAYNHGVRVSENPTSLTAPIEGTAGLQVIIGTAPVNLAADPYAAANKPIIAYSFAEASAAVGYCDDFKNYTMCESIDASFRVFNVAPIVLINVLDPTNTGHTKALEETYADVKAMQAVIEVPGILADRIEVVGVKDHEEIPSSGKLKAGEDYIVTFDSDGNAVITILKDEKIKKVRVSGTNAVLNPAGVQDSDIIGSYNAGTGVETGLEVIRQIFPKLGLTPGILVAPKWSKSANVAAAIAAKCEGINGVFSCEAIVDIGTETGTGAAKYTDVKDAKEKAAMVSPHVMAAWPCARVGDKIYHASAILAALTAYTDAENGDVPNLSPSNKSVPISGICLEDGTEVILDEQQANLVNSYGVTTFNNFQGWVSWGNNSVAYPSTTDPKDRWFCCRRFFSWWENSFVLTYHQRVDNPNDPRQVEAIVDSENIRGNSFVAQGKCAGAYIEYRQQDNPITDVMGGKMQFYMHLSPYTPAEDIYTVFEFDPSLLEAAFTGGE